MYYYPMIPSSDHSVVIVIVMGLPGRTVEFVHPSVQYPHPFPPLPVD